MYLKPKNLAALNVLNFVGFLLNELIHFFVLIKMFIVVENKFLMCITVNDVSFRLSCKNIFLFFCSFVRSEDFGLLELHRPPSADARRKRK